MQCTRIRLLSSSAQHRQPAQFQMATHRVEKNWDDILERECEYEQVPDDETIMTKIAENNADAIQYSEVIYQVFDTAEMPIVEATRFVCEYLGLTGQSPSCVLVERAYEAIDKKRLGIRKILGGYFGNTATQALPWVTRLVLDYAIDQSADYNDDARKELIETVFENVRKESGLYC